MNRSLARSPVYGEQRGQRDVYEQTARDAVLSTLQGYNATIIAYGQTGTGKTYTMEGYKYASNPNKPLILMP